MTEPRTPATRRAAGRGLIAAGLGLILGSASPAAGQHEGHAPGGRSGASAALGTVAFPNSGAAAAQPAFLRGLALLHSFEYDDAGEAFREAQRIDAAFSLAFWAEAFAYSHVIWGEEDVPAAVAALARAGASPEARLARARTPSERSFGQAVETFYGPGDLRSRVGRFAESAEAWAQAAPSDLEARSFAALGGLWRAHLAADPGEGERWRTGAVAHAQHVFAASPQHPGGAHYLIHAYDSPAHAATGLSAARAYAAIAPDAEHALHMPSHIFLPLGMWDDMVASNERAWAASRAGNSRNNRPAWYNDWHGLNWLQYAYLQQGRWRAAESLIDSARTLAAEARRNPTAVRPDPVFAMEQLAFRYGLETGRWNHWTDEEIRLDWRDTTLTSRARGMAMTSTYQQAAAALLARGDTVPAAAATRAFRDHPGPVQRRLGSLLEVMLQAARGDTAGAIAALTRMQAETGTALNRSMVPPSTLIASEQLAELLLASGRAAEAIAAYESALAQRPGRAVVLLGLARAQAAAGNAGAALAVRGRLAEQWAAADREASARLDAGN